MNNPWFNKTLDFNQNGSVLNSLENESLTQDSLFMNREDQGSVANTFRAALTKTPGNHGAAMSTSSQFRTIQADDINIRDSNVIMPEKRKLAQNEGSGPLASSCIRNLKPS